MTERHSMEQRIHETHEKLKSSAVDRDGRSPPCLVLRPDDRKQGLPVRI